MPGAPTGPPRTPPPVTVLILDLALNLFPFWATWAKVVAVREGVVTGGPSGLEQDGGCGYGVMKGTREDRQNNTIEPEFYPVGLGGEENL